MAQPPVVKFDAAANGDRTGAVEPGVRQATQAAEPQRLEELDKSQDQSSFRPKRLPFLGEITSRGPTSGTGTFALPITYVVHARVRGYIPCASCRAPCMHGLK